MMKPPLSGDLVLAPIEPEGADEIEVAANSSPLDFLCAVYRDPCQPMPRRMRAAAAALPFVHPKLAVVANVTSFAAQMEELSRQRGRSNVIDAKANHSLTQPASGGVADPERSGDVG
jgi:hypothetical protein